MKNSGTLGILSLAFVLGMVATSAISGCQSNTKPVAEATDSSSSEEAEASYPETSPNETSSEATEEALSEETAASSQPGEAEAAPAEPTPQASGEAATAQPGDTPAEEKGPQPKAAEAEVAEQPAPEQPAPEQPAPNPGKEVAAVTAELPQGDEPPAPADPKQDEVPKVEDPDTEAETASGSETASEPPAAAAAGQADQVPPLTAGDWSQWGGNSHRNNVPVMTRAIPLEWNIGQFDRKTGQWISDEAENIKWVAAVGSQTYGNPVVANGKVYVGTNNGAGYLKRYPSQTDLGCLICFNEADGKFLWQHSSEKLPTGRVHDWPLQGICCAPYVEGNRVWFVTSRGEVRCLDAEGYYDNEDDGPVKNELARLFLMRFNEDPTKDSVAPAVAELAEGKLPESLAKLAADAGETLENPQVSAVEGKANQWAVMAQVNGADRQFKVMKAGENLTMFKVVTPLDKQEADTIWVFNMMDELGVSQHNMCSCSVTALGDILFVNTSNGLDESHLNLPNPNAPSFIAMDKNTGKVLWTDASPGTNILHGQWSSPTVGILGGVPQVIFAGGDGWVYSFRADAGKDGKPELLWQFDANPKTTKWILGGQGTRNNIIATPVIYDGLVYVAVGQDPEHGEGDGHLWCIDPTKRGDLSPQLAVNVQDRTKPIPHKRLQAVVEEDGEVAIDNPNSGVVWHYYGTDRDGNGELDFEEQMHRSCGTVAIKDNLLYIADFSGLFHCLDAKTGKAHWTYDMFAAAWGSPLIAGDHVYIGDEDGDVAIFKLTAMPHDPVAEINMGNSVYSTPIVANGVLILANRTHVFAIESPDAAASE